MKTYSFDVTLLTTISIAANSRREAEATLRDCVGDANLGAFPNGDPILCEVAIEGELDLAEIEEQEEQRGVAR
jgi:hypothetical protein